jgi:beta-galactosidase
MSEISNEEPPRVRLDPRGLLLSRPTGSDAPEEVVPLWAASVHYWRLERADWRACLTAVRDLGFRLVDLYVPWGVHERAPGELDLGQHDPRLDVVAFLRLIGELGLHAIVRPGPHINAELSYFGIPERIVWDPACQAKSPGGNPVVLPMIPAMFPVPSYASEAYLDETTRYFSLIGATLGPLRHPDGPIVMVQIDNEGAMFFRDGPFDQDHHPDAISRYREFVRERRRNLDALRTAYPRLAQGLAEGEALRFSDLVPPSSLEAETLADLVYHLDWAAFQEDLLARAFGRLARALRDAGLAGIPTSHNFPLAQDRTALNAARINEAVDLVGFDYYNRASESDRAEVARRTGELALRSEKLGVPAFACEIGAGFPPFFPPLSERDSAFTMLAALAYGLRGFNVYMAVERDRWVGAPIDPHGGLRPFATFWKKLVEALDRAAFHTLRRRVPVRLLVPRIERRLARVTHAFGPATGALLAVMGQGPRESCVEDDFGTGHPLAIEADTFLRSFEQALDARGVPFAVVGGEDRDVAFDGADWVICATSGGFAESLARRLVDVAHRGARVTVGPRARRFDGDLRPLEDDLLAGKVELLEATDPATADAAVSRAVEALELPRFACDPDPVHATVHEDAAGELRVIFVINPSDEDYLARVAIGVEATFHDGIDGSITRSDGGVLETRMRPKTVRMFLRS